MFYKPKFCCNCGEKIETIDWKLWTSRRFCDVCAVEQKEHELLPRVIVAIAVLFGIFGVGGYLQKQDVGLVKNELNALGSSSPKRAVAAETKRQPVQVDPSVYGLEINRSDSAGTAKTATESPTVAESKEQPKIRKIASEESIYFCGAMTKKGKPCSRRVKSNERCWQHVGQPSSAPARKVPDVF